MQNNVFVRGAVRVMAKKLISDPDKNMPRALHFVEKLDRKGVNQNIYPALERVVTNRNNNWNIFLHNIFRNVAPDVLERLSGSLVLNAAIKAFPQRMAAIEKYGCNIPWAILMDPTAACNLHCTGCWAAEYGKNCALPYDVMERIIAEGEELGDYVYLFSGGEPLCRKDDLIRLCESHPECVFLAFSNGTLVDEKFAREMKRVGNFALAFSIEGWEEETDMRRGKGTYQKVLHAMDLLRAEGVPFGFSCCYHSKNTEVIGSDEWVDFLIEKGCLFGWYFTYIPCGKDAVPELLATPEQRGSCTTGCAISERPSPRSCWISGTTANTSWAAWRADATICTSTPTVTWSPARSSITPTSTSRTARCSRRSKARCSCNTSSISPSTATTCAPAPCSTIPR